MSSTYTKPATTLQSLEPLLKEIWQVELNDMMKDALRRKAQMQGYKRNRNGRIKWQWKMLFK